VYYASYRRLDPAPHSGNVHRHRTRRRGPVTRMPLSPRQRRNGPPCTVVTGRPTAVELIHNTYVARQIIKMQDDETYVLCAVGKLIIRDIILYQTTRIFSLTPCGTLYTKPRRPPLRSSSVLN